jgi:tetratricopeptide (TPR) repeat protein
MRGCKLALVLGLSLPLHAARVAAQNAPIDTAKLAFEQGEYNKAVGILKTAATQSPNSGEIHLLLAKSYLELKQYDNAVNSAERAVAIDAKNSVYHQWLGEAYGAKADHASMLSAYSLARKTQKEFSTAVELDPHNYDAAQDLVEYDCTAPSVVGGGEDKAQPLIAKLMDMNAAEGHYAAAVCKAQKKDYAGSDAEFAKALDSKPQTANRVYDIGDYFLQRGQADKLLIVAAQGQTLASKDPRGVFYEACARILKGEKLPEAEKLLHDYLQTAPPNSEYPAPWQAHYWLGRGYEAQKNPSAARNEYDTALKLNPKSKLVQDALKHLGGS